MGLFRRIFKRKKKPAEPQQRVHEVAQKLSFPIAMEIKNRSAAIIEQQCSIHNVSPEQLRKAAELRINRYN